jgi:hypothetical protein
MKLEYTCTNRACPEKDKNQYRLALPAELAMDDHNIADIFCPKCKRMLVRTGQNEKGHLQTGT